MFYERKIVYLDYLVKQEKCGNVGFVKLEVRGTFCNININVKGLRETDSFPVKAYIVGNGQEQVLCSLELQQGRAQKQLLQLDSENIVRSGIGYNDLEAIKIVIAQDRELCTVIKKKSEITASKEEISDAKYEGQAIEMEELQDISMKSEECDHAPETNEQGSEMDESAAEMSEDRKEMEAAEAEQEVLVKECDADIQEAVIQETNIQKRNIPLYDHKWKQLWEIYPHVSPFMDEREFLSVGPGDFVILPEKYFRMANNSFLLHGYYNYRHLILKKLELRGETRYYIGVPGNFYDREKQVALMFGFESFESLKEPAQAGDYGYYLMRIEL